MVNNVLALLIVVCIAGATWYVINEVRKGMEGIEERYECIITLLSKHELNSATERAALAKELRLIKRDFDKLFKLQPHVKKITQR